MFVIPGLRCDLGLGNPKLTPGFYMASNVVGPSGNVLGGHTITFTRMYCALSDPQPKEDCEIAKKSEG